MYDAVIIGAGIGGLVCGCFLAKAGMKVLIVEQHHKPGGYCTSFSRKGFYFDAAAHSFGGYRNGPLGNIFRELGLEKRLSIQRFNPSDTIVTPDYRVSFWSDVEETIADFQSSFPDEKENIKNFFYFLFDPDPNAFARIRSWTFNMLLDNYFHNSRLKAILSYPLLGNGGLPPSLISAFLGAKIYKEFLLDGGYYPEGGMQKLPDALAEILREFGGELQLSRLVRKIRVSDNKVDGILLEKAEFIPCKMVVSNCSARHTFLNLLGINNIPQDFAKKLNGMIPSLSMFIAYLGMDQPYTEWPAGINMWFLFKYDVHSLYRSSKRWDYKNIDGYMAHLSGDRRWILAFLNAPFKSRKYWAINKSSLLNYFIERLEKTSIPGLSQHLIYRDAATPSTLARYTLNYKGAAYGWEGIPSQFVDSDFRKPSFLQGLYLTGHWSTQGLGIPGVTYLGFDTARMLIKRARRKYLI